MHQVWAKCYYILCVCVSLAGHQIQGLHQFLSLPSVQSGPCAGRCGAGVRLLRTQWVTLTNATSVSHTHALTPSYILLMCNFSICLPCSEKGNPDVQLGLPARGRLLLLLRPRLQPLPAGRRPHRDLLTVGSLLRRQRRHLQLDLPASRRQGFFNGIVIRKPHSRRRYN